MADKLKPANKLLKIWLWLGWLAIFLIPVLWYNGQEIIVGADLTFPLNPAEYLETIFQLWRRVGLGGNSAISLTTLPFYAPMALFDWLGFSLKMVQQFHFGFWLALPALSMFYLTGVIFKDFRYKLYGQLVAVSVYIFNSYEVVWADSARMAVWVGLPLMFAFFVQGLNEPKLWWRWSMAIAIASVTTSTAAANPPMFIMFAAIFIFWLIFQLVFNSSLRNINALIKIGKFLALTITLSLLINLFWIVPYGNVLLNDYRGALTSGLAGIQFTDWLGPLSTNTSILNVFRLQGAWDWYAGWQGEPYVPAAFPYQHNIFYLVWSLCVPILAFSALLFKVKSKNRQWVVFFSALALLGLLMGAGSHPPTGKVYQWLLDTMPFLSIYRSPWYKFTTWTVSGYSLLSGMSIMLLIEYLSSKQSSWPSWWPNKLRLNIKVGFSGLVSLIIIGNLIYSSGLVLGKVFPKREERKRLHSAHVTFPAYFFRSADWINAQTGDWRILQLPAQEAFNYKWGLGALMDMTIFSFKQPTIWWPEQTGSGPAKSGGESMIKQAYNRLYAAQDLNLGRLYGLLNIRYLLQKDDIDYSFYGGIDSPEFVKQKIDEQNFKLAHQEGPWNFYEINSEDQRPLIFSTNRLIQTNSDEKDLVATILSPIYRQTDTYTNQKVETPSTKINKGYSARAKIEQSVIVEDQLQVPIEALVDGNFLLSFKAVEPVTVMIDNLPQVVETVNQVSQVKLNLKAGEHILGLKLVGGLANLIENANFEQGIGEQPIDSSQTWPGTAQFSAELVNDGSSGLAVRVSSRNHSAAMRRGFKDFESDRQYLLSFDYRWLKGQPPKFGVWQEQAFVIEPGQELAKKTEWTQFQTVFQPRSTAQGVQLFLYADPTKEGIETIIDYDNIKAIKLPKLLDSLTLSTDATISTEQSPSLSFKRISAGAYQVTVSQANQPYIINFLEQFDRGWQLTKLDGSLLKAEHFTAFGYANGWAINSPGSYDLLLKFKPQNTFQVVAFLSVTTLLISLIILYWPTAFKFNFRRKNG